MMAIHPLIHLCIIIGLYSIKLYIGLIALQNWAYLTHLRPYVKFANN